MLAKPLSELVGDFEAFPQVLVNVRVSEKTPIDEIPALRERIAGVEEEMGGAGRVLIRYSGTEKKARVMVEGEDQAKVQAYADELADALRRAVGGEG